MSVVPPLSEYFSLNRFLLLKSTKLDQDFSDTYTFVIYSEAPGNLLQIKTLGKTKGTILVTYISYVQFSHNFDLRFLLRTKYSYVVTFGPTYYSCFMIAHTLPDVVATIKKIPCFCSVLEVELFPYHAVANGRVRRFTFDRILNFRRLLSNSI